VKYVVNLSYDRLRRALLLVKTRSRDIHHNRMMNRVMRSGWR